MAAEGAQLSRSQAKELAAIAKTPEDHLNLAAYYTNAAVQAEAEAVEHQTFADENRGKGNMIGVKGAMNPKANASGTGWVV